FFVRRFYIILTFEVHYKQKQNTKLTQTKCMRTTYKKLLLLLLLLPFSVLAQSTLSGTVSDNATGEPLPGVNVIVEGTTNGVATNIDGKHSLSDVNSGDIIVFSFIGYADQVLQYNGEATFNAVLQEDSTQLEEAVVIGYGSTTKKDATGALTTVTSKDFTKGAVMSSDQLIVGKAPGVRITNAGGAPDSAPNIRIR